MSESERDRAIDRLYDAVDEMLMSERFEDVDKILDTAATNILPMSVWLSLLTVTLPWKNRLSERHRLVEVVRRAAGSRNVLDGLE